MVVADDLSRIEFTVENRTGGAHESGLSIAGLPPGEYDVTVVGKRVATIKGGGNLTLPVTASSSRVSIQRR